MKLSLKINLLFTLIVSGILLVMSISIYNINRNNVLDEFRQRLKNRAARTAYLYDALKDDTTNLLKSLDAASPAALVNKNINVYNEAGQLLYEYHDENTQALEPDTNWFREAMGKEQAYFSAGKKDVCLFNSLQGEIHYFLIVAAENVAGQEYINNLKRLFRLYLPAAVLFTLLAGYLFSMSIINPIKGTIRDAQLITSQNLSQRLYVGKRKDELADLNATFNELLNRLEESFAIQRRFLSNASHELSTPLTSISSQIEVALLYNRSGEEYRKVLESVLEDVKELHQLTKNILEIAKAGTHGAISLDKVRIDEILIKAHGEVLRQDSRFRIGLEFPNLPEAENECMVFGNSLLLHSAFKNIMENGCKYSPDNNVRVQLFFHGFEAEILFTNKSDSISAEEIGRLFEPFYRSVNSEGKPGVGLGLTLTRRIIRLHKGSIDVQSDDEKGTQFRIILPTLKK